MPSLFEEKFKPILETKRNDLLDRISYQRGGKLSRAEAAAAHYYRSEDSHAQLISSRDLDFSIDEHELEELAAIDSALERLTGGTYGYCTDCKSPISDSRLNVVPEASCCIDCQANFEKKRK
jgi:DnaK suppressor protein